MTDKSVENKGIPGYSPMDAFKVLMENYIFVERWDPALSKNIKCSMATTKIFIWW